MGQDFYCQNATIIGHKLIKITSIFTTENYAIYEGKKLADTIDLNGILIVSTILAFKKLFLKQEITQNIQAKLTKTKKNIEFMGLPFHIGIIGNEKADKYDDHTTKLIINPTKKGY